MSEEERLDIVEGVDEEGNRLILRVNRYFFYNGEEYVLLSDDIEEPNPNLDEVMFYVMKVTESVDEDGEEIEELILYQRIESTSWLIQNHHWRLVEEREHNPDFLLIPAAEFANGAIEIGGDAFGDLIGECGIHSASQRREVFHQAATCRSVFEAKFGGK